MARIATVGLLILSIALTLCTTVLAGESKEDKEKAKADKERQEIRKMAQETLARLYKVQPNAKKAVEAAAGYAVFGNFGMKIFIAGGGSGKGVAVNNATRKETFMKMLEIQAGLGFGIKKFSQVWVFQGAEALKQFVDSGWQFGGQTTAGARVNSEGASVEGAVSVAPGVWVYQLTDTGLALELTAKGTKYYKDDTLNR